MAFLYYMEMGLVLKVAASCPAAVQRPPEQ